MRRPQSGTALVVTVLFTAVFAVLVTAIYTLMRSTLQDAFYQRKSAQAGGLAEAGLDDGLLRVKNSAFCASTAAYSRTLEEGSFTVRLVPALDVSVASAVARGEPAAITITSTGTVSGFAPWGSVHRSLSLRMRPRRTTMVNGIFATTGSVTVGFGAAIDSYDSRIELEPSTFGSEATVVSNAALATPATFWVLISTSDLACETGQAGITPGSAYDQQSRALSVTGAVTIEPGLYHFSSIDVAPGGSLTTSGSGRVDIHLAGSLDARGPIVNSGKKPSDLVVQGISGVIAPVRLDYAGNFFGVLLVSSQPVTIGPDVRVFGGVTGASIELQDGSRIHYDLALSTRTAQREGVYLGEYETSDWRATN